VHRMLDELTDLFRLRATEKGLTLLLTRDPGVPQVIETDDKKLRQILLNLLSNAVKFTEQGGVGLRVTFADGLLWCEVQDTGPGIPPQDLETIFEPFVQTTFGLKSKDGTGLGLAISRQFAQLLGGTLTAFSTGEPGQGALFMLHLPAGMPLIATQEASVPGAGARLTVVALAPGQPTYRILIAEDRLENSELLRLLLAKLGFEVRVAVNGLEAINVWRDWQPQLILMDMRMPIMDGHEATRRIKAAVPGRATIIIALTAGAFDDEREQARLDGCDDFLSKPFHPNDVAELLAKHLGVSYTYRSGTGPLLTPIASPIDTHPPIDAAQLAQLPAAWRQQVALAARAADADLLMALIAQIHSAQPHLAAALSDLTYDFEYDAILRALTAHGEI
jgi:CheY-like chemotaxis protein